MTVIILYINMSFERQIKEWVTIDNKIKQYNDEIKNLRNKKNEITDEINHYVEENEMKQAIVNISDGRLKFQTSKVTQPLTLKFLKECLMDCMNDEENVEKIINYIKEQRDVKYVDEIKRYYNKK